MHMRKYFQTIQSSLLLNKDGQRELAFTHQCPKMSKRENSCFLTKIFQSCQISIIWNLLIDIPLRLLLKPWTLSFNKNTIRAKTVSQLKCLQERKRLRFTLERKDPALHSLLQTCDTILEVMLAKNLVWCCEGKAYQTWIVHLHSLRIYTDLIVCNIVGDTQAPLLRCFFNLKTKSRGHFIYWTVHELTDI